MNHDAQCPLCGKIEDTDNVKICKYHQGQLLHPELNYREAEEQDLEALKVCSDYYDGLLKSIYKL